MASSIVLIDDDSDDLDLMKESLHLVNPNVHCMSFIYPEDALKLLLQQNGPVPKFIFIDYSMPKVAGAECLARFRSERKFDATTITIYSTSMPSQTAHRLIDMGANFTFQKPIRIEDYYEILSGILHNRFKSNAPIVV